MDDSKEWIRTKEAAELLGVRRQSMAKVAAAERVRRRKLPSITVRYYRPDLLALLRRYVVDGTARKPVRAKEPQADRA